MKLYGDKRSGNCHKVQFVAHVVGLDYEWIEVDSLVGKTRTDEFLSMSPMGQIPYLQLEDGRGIAQSNAIALYLAQGSSLIPDDNFDRAQLDQWLFWEANNYEYFIANCIGDMMYMGKTIDQRDPMRVTRAEQSLGMLDAHLQSRQWIVGDDVSVADACLLAYTRLAHLGGFDLTARANIRQWITRADAAFSLDPV